MRRIKKQTNKKWLFDTSALQVSGLLQFGTVFFYIVFFKRDTVWSYGFSLGFSISIILFALALYVAIYHASPKLRKDMAKQHPSYKFA
jgi:F0F1-type ATP synthase assembly protein I